MALTTIEYGSLASSATLNNNFNYLDGRITTSAGSIASLSTQISTVNTNLSTNKANTDMSNVTDATLTSKLSSTVLTNSGCLTSENISNANSATKTTITGWIMPNMSNGISVSSGYTASTAGYICLIIRLTGDDPYYSVTVDGVEAYRFSRGGDFGSGHYVSCFIPVGKDSVVAWSLSQGSVVVAKFIKVKGV